LEQDLRLALGIKAAADLTERAANRAAQEAQSDDRHDRNECEDQGVLGKTLALIPQGPGAHADMQGSEKIGCSGNADHDPCIGVARMIL
jgi:hypothetical protein